MGGWRPLTRDLEALFIVVLDGPVLNGLVEEIDKGEDELLFLQVCHRGQCLIYNPNSQQQ